MQFQLLFSAGNKDEWEFIYQYLNEHYHNSRIIVQNVELTNFLTNKGLNASTFDYLFPDEGKTGEEIYSEAKELREEFRSVFENIVYKNISIFSGFEYSFLRELLMLVKMKRILNSKQEDTVAIFTGFYFIYFAMLGAASTIGYSCQPNIGFINDNRIEYLSHDDENLISIVGNKFKLIKARKYLKSSTTGKPFTEKFKGSIQFYFKVASFASRFLRHKIKSSVRIEKDEVILTQIEKKIIHTYGQLEADCLLCITAVREDLYLKPWKPVFEKFRSESKNFHIITSDLSSAIMLSKQDLPYMNLFEDMNIMSESIRKSSEGDEIRKKITENIVKNSSIIGIEKLSTYFISQSFRSASLILILDHLISKSRPKSVIVAADGEMLENLSSVVSRKYKIPSYSMLPGAVQYRPLFADWFHADKIFVPGTSGLELLKKLGYEQSRIIITGNPKYDYVRGLDPEYSKKQIANEIGLDPKKKIISVVMSRWHENDEIWMSNLIRFCNKHNFEIIIKIHPLYKREDNQISEEKINIIKNNCKNLQYFVGYDYILSILLAASDLVITEYSDVGVEVISLGKPLITVNFDYENFEQFIRYDQYGAAIYINDYQKLEEKIFEILIQDKYSEQLREAGKKILEMYNNVTGNSASDVIFKILKNSNEYHIAS